MPVQCYCRQTGLLEDSEGHVSQAGEFSKKGRAFIATPFLAYRPFTENSL